MGLQIPHEKGNFNGKKDGPWWSIMTLCHELCKNCWTNQDDVWDLDSGGLKKQVLGGMYTGLLVLPAEQWCNWEGEGGGERRCAPGRSRQGGTKQADQKYFMINDHKSDFDTVSWMRQM